MSASDHAPLGAGSEFDAIRQLLQQWGPYSLGIGDDAAILDVRSGERLLASVDTTIEGVHFRRTWLTPTEVGYRAVIAALSDLAAMGAAPIGILTAIALPGSWKARLSELAEGIARAVADSQTVIVGGNLSAATDLSITTTVLGSASHVLRRTAVRAGDLLYITGRLGGPGAALESLMAGRTPEPEHRERFAHPIARLAEGRWLAEAGAHAAVDLSDGLVSDAAHLARASTVGLEIDLRAIPLIAGVPPRDALASGEEYELLVSAPEALDAKAFEAAFGVPLTAIGRAVADHAGEVHVLDEGRRVAGGHGYDHFLA